MRLEYSQPDGVFYTGKGTFSGLRASAWRRRKYPLDFQVKIYPPSKSIYFFMLGTKDFPQTAGPSPQPPALAGVIRPT
jgi:hypothetical protein